MDFHSAFIVAAIGVFVWIIGSGVAGEPNGKRVGELMKIIGLIAMCAGVLIFVIALVIVLSAML